MIRGFDDGGGLENHGGILLVLVPFPGAFEGGSGKGKREEGRCW